MSSPELCERIFFLQTNNADGLQAYHDDIWIEFKCDHNYSEKPI